jgi:hypothetical protein
MLAEHTRSRVTLPDLTTLSRCQLLALKQEVEEGARSIRNQIERAKAEFAISGERADPDWFQRATAALRAKGGQAQRIAYQLGVLKEKGRAAAVPEESFSRAFMKAAKQRLTGSEYAEIVAVVRETHAEEASV